MLLKATLTQQGDADRLSLVFVCARVTAMPWLVSPQDEAATRWWMEHVVLAEQLVRVAYDRTGLLGFAAVDRGRARAPLRGP